MFSLNKIFLTIQSSVKKGGDFFALSSEHQQKIKEQIEGEVAEKSDIFILTFFAAVLLTSGLIFNNFFIILGSLLLTPVIWPVLAILLKIIQNQLKDFTAWFLFGKIVLLSIIVSFVLGWCFARGYDAITIIRPNYSTFVVALFVGFLSTFVVSYPKLGSFIARLLTGAVILTPLCLTGIAIARLDFAGAADSFLSFIIALTAVFIGATLFFLTAGFKIKSRIKLNLKSKTGAVALVLLVMIVFVVVAFIVDSYSLKRRQSILIKTTLEQNIGESQINRLDIDKTADKLLIKAVISAKKNLSNREINLLADKLSQAVNRSVSLQITAFFSWQAEKIINPAAKNSKSPIKQNNQQLEGMKDSIFPKILNQK